MSLGRGVLVLLLFLLLVLLLFLLVLLLLLLILLAGHERSYKKENEGKKEEKEGKERKWEEQGNLLQESLRETFSSLILRRFSSFLQTGCYITL